jgi:hypothetical protein
VTAHGTNGCYIKGCRRDECRMAHASYQREWLARNPDRIADPRPAPRTSGSMRAEDVKRRLLAEDPTDWMAAAACRDQELGDVLARVSRFFADDDGNSTNAYRDARRICLGCPVRDDCLEYAYRHHLTDGFWGGLSPRGRRAEAKRRRLEAYNDTRIPARNGSMFTMAAEA